MCFASSPEIINCTINGNWANHGGGIFCRILSDPTIRHCTISGNTADNNGGGIYCYGSSPNIVNTIVERSTGDGGIYFNDSPDVAITYGNFYNNEEGNFTGDSIPSGLGLLTSVNTNSDSCDTFFNIFADPLFEDTSNSNFQITWANYPTWDETRSPCIDAGDPNLPFDPDSTVPDIGAFYYHQIPQALPQAIDDLTITQLGNDAVLSWSPVVNDTWGNPIDVSFYVVYMSTIDPFFIPTSLDSIGAVTPPDTTFTDINVFDNPMRFYNVKAILEN